MSYQPLPTSPDSLDIDDDAAVVGKGWRVQIEPKQKHLVPFSVTRLDYAPLPKVVLFIIAFFVLCIAGVLGGGFLRYFAAPNIHSYLDYPRTNCTITDSETTKSGDYIIQVFYLDSSGSIHNDSLFVDGGDFISRNWSVGSAFMCLYKGSFLEAFDTIYSSYEQMRKLWYVGIVVPVGVLLLFALPTTMRILLVERNSTIRFYPRWISYVANRDFAIEEWSSIGSDLRQFFYLLLLTYYSEECETSARQISFSETTTYKRNAFTHVLSLVFIFLIGSSPFVLIGLGIYEMRGYEYYGYLLGLILFAVGAAILPLSIYVLQKYFWAQQKSIVTNELWIQYSMHNHGRSMKGWIAVK